MDPVTLAEEIAKLELTDAAIVDCTAADSVGAGLPGLCASESSHYHAK